MGTYWNKYLENPYDEGANKDGIVNMGVAENTLCADIIKERFSRADMTGFDTWMQYYQEHRGMARFREAIANFMTTFFKAATPVDPNHLVVTTGGDCTIDFLLHAFTDPGDSLLVPAPYYYSIRQNAAMRCNIECYDINLDTGSVPDKMFEITDELLETGYQNALKEGKRVRAILVINPHNPTGKIYNEDTITATLEFAKRHELHVLMDEIYALTVFGEGAEFHSILERKSLPDPERTHLIWGFSKDFCLPGFRVGVIHSFNSGLVTSLGHLSCMASVSTLVQHKLTTMLNDEDWIKNTFLKTNHGRLRDSYKYAENRLRSMGVTCQPATAAYFIWARFNQAKTREEERALCLSLLDAGVLIAPGTPLASGNPGWFRITITHPHTYLKLGMDRIETRLRAIDGEV